MKNAENVLKKSENVFGIKKLLLLQPETLLNLTI